MGFDFSFDDSLPCKWCFDSSIGFRLWLDKVLALCTWLSSLFMCCFSFAIDFGNADFTTTLISSHLFTLPIVRSLFNLSTFKLSLVVSCVELTIFSASKWLWLEFIVQLSVVCPDEADDVLPECVPFVDDCNWTRFTFTITFSIVDNRSAMINLHGKFTFISLISTFKRENWVFCST